MAIWGNQWEMAAISHRDSDQRSVRVALCPAGEGCQPSQPYSESEEIQQPTVTHFQFHSLCSIVVLQHLFQLSDRATKRSKRELESGYPHAKASVTILAPRKVSHLLVREASALIFMLSRQFFIISITNVKKCGFHLCSGVFKADGYLHDLLLPAAQHVDSGGDQSQVSLVEQHLSGGLY